MDIAALVLYKLLALPASPTAGSSPITGAVVSALTAFAVGAAAVWAMAVRPREAQGPANAPPRRNTADPDPRSLPGITSSVEQCDPASPLRRSRRHATVMFTDAVGFSIAMDADEEATLDGLIEDLHLITAACRACAGTVLKTVGDGVVAVFEETGDAVRCARVIQSRMARRAGPHGSRLRHRIGIHAGLVLACDGEVMGTTVNVAARLEREAPAGGICISQGVVDACGGLPAGFQPRGEKTLRNIRDAVELYVLPARAIGSNVIPFSPHGRPPSSQKGTVPHARTGAV